MLQRSLLLLFHSESVILAHNHPSGSFEPSEEDIAVTKQLSQAGQIMGIAVLDHIIFNQHGYFSFVEKGIKFSYE